MSSYRQNDTNRRDASAVEAYSSSSSAQSSNFSAAATQQQNRLNYAPGTGAAFMAQSGWSNRDAYGRPRRQSTTVFPVFTPAPRLPHQLPSFTTAQRHQQREEEGFPPPPHQVTFTEAPNYKKVYLIALIIIGLLFLSLIALVIVLLATKVFIYNSARSSSSAPPPNPINPQTASLEIPLPPPSPSSSSLSPPIIQPTNQPHLVTRTFECEFYILDQANQAYDNPNSFEQYQAHIIIQNALVTTFESSSLRDMNPTIGLEKLENSGPDLRILFRLSIVILEQNTGLRELAIRNLLLGEAGVLEGLLNRTNLDRNRVSVRFIN